MGRADLRRQGRAAYRRGDEKRIIGRRNHGKGKEAGRAGAGDVWILYRGQACARGSSDPFAGIRESDGGADQGRSCGFGGVREMTFALDGFKSYEGGY